MKIIQLTAENIKKLKVVDITPTKDFIQITGKNGSGKTSVLDAIWWALAGKDAIQGQPIRKGEHKAMIRLNLGECVVTRRFTESGTTLVVENGDGFRAASPQAMLDAIIGHLAFDPLEFSRMDAKKQFDALKVIADVGVDLEALTKEDENDKNRRRDITRDIKTLQGQLAGIVYPFDAPDEEVNVGDLIKELGELENRNTIVLENERAHEKYEARIKEIDATIEDLQAKIADLKEAKVRGHAMIDALPAMTAKSTDSVKAQIAGAQEINKGVAAKKQNGELNAKIALMQNNVDVIETILKERESIRAKALLESKMPINGLTLGDKEVLYRDIPFDQLSAAEQLRVSVAIAMAANPKLKVIRIKDGSLLDDASLKIIQEMAAEREYQVWCETVNTTGKVGIVMEDGEVAAINEGE